MIVVVGHKNLSRVFLTLPYPHFPYCAFTPVQNTGLTSETVQTALGCEAVVTAYPLYSALMVHLSGRQMGRRAHRGSLRQTFALVSLG